MASNTQEEILQFAADLGYCRGVIAGILLYGNLPISEWKVLRDVYVKTSKDPSDSNLIQLEAIAARQGTNAFPPL